MRWVYSPFLASSAVSVALKNFSGFQPRVLTFIFYCILIICGCDWMAMQAPYIWNGERDMKPSCDSHKWSSVTHTINSSSFEIKVVCINARIDQIMFSYLSPQSKYMISIYTYVSSPSTGIPRTHNLTSSCRAQFVDHEISATTAQLGSEHTKGILIGNLTDIVTFSRLSETFSCNFP